MNKNTSLFGRWRNVFAGGVIGLLSLGVLVLGAPSAQAQMMTVAELQAQINLLLAQLARIQGNTSTSCFEFSRDLTVGSTGLDVSALQNYLKTTDHFPFAVGTTGYFGDVTHGAVVAWQSSNSIVPAAGYFGPLSRARYALLCQPVNVTPDDGDDDDDDDNNTDTDDDADADDAEEAIQDARAAIDDAEDEIEEADDDGDDVDEARDLLEDANSKLDDAEEALDDDEFDDAVELADDAMKLADDAVDAIGEDDDNDGDSSVESTSAEAPVGNNKDRADYDIEFTLHAFNGDFYISRSTERDDDSSDGSDGIEFYLEESSGDVYTGGDVAVSFSSDDDNNGDTDDYFKIDDDETRTFMLSVSLDNEGATAGFYGLQINAIRYDTNTSAGGEITISNGLDDHDTQVVFVDDSN